jgi:hypothetical protein
MSTYDAAVDILETELQQVERVFRDLTPADWRTPTLLQPFDEKREPWTVFELAGHFDISIGLTRMLISSAQPGQPGRDRISFFIYARSEVAPAVYDYAYTMVEGKKPEQMPDVLHETFSGTISESRKTPPETVGSGYYALMRLDEFVPSRIVEAVVHGMDLTDALGRPSVATPAGLAVTAGILDELLARRTVAGRPGGPRRRHGLGTGGVRPHPAPRSPPPPHRLTASGPVGRLRHMTRLLLVTAGSGRSIPSPVRRP